MVEDRRRASFAIPLIAVMAILVGAAMVLTIFVPVFKCPACRPMEPGYAVRVTHTGSCEFCDGEDRVTLRNWFKAREYRSYAYEKE